MLYVLYGSDNFSRTEKLKQIKEELDSDGSLSSGTAVFDARQATPQEVVAACETLPFLSPHRLVIVEGLLQPAAGAPARRRRRASAAEAALGPWQLLVDRIDSFPPTTTLVILDGEVRSSPLLDALRGKGKLIAFPKLKGGSLTGWVIQRARSAGLKLDAPVPRLLVQLAGDDLWALASEIEKLDVYAGGQPVGEQDVHSLVSPRDSSIFALVDAVAEGKRTLALRLLHELLDQGKSTQHVFSMLQRQYRNLAIARELLDARQPAHRIGEAVAVKGFALEKLVEQASRLRLSRIRGAYRRLLDTDVSIKRGIYDELLALELLVQDLTGTASRAA